VTRFPNRLLAPEPGWQTQVDVIIIGSGIAGLTTALHVRASGATVLLVTKGRVDEGSTRWAQGGIAAALAEDDSPAEHMQDTLEAGAGLCDVDAVRVLVEAGPAAVADLVKLGAHFDQDASGALALGREGGHLKDRIAHAGGDATGAEISRALVAAVERDPGIEIMEHTLVLDLLTDGAHAAQGITVHSMTGGERDGVGAALAPNIVLATGGFGQVFGQTTNPHVATGDGVAMAFRAGAAIADLEFVQFHPTVLWLGALAQGQQPLVSEAVRGEGAVLRDNSGIQFMLDEHELADLAPRDVVAKAIMRKMRDEDSLHVWLDARSLGADTWLQRFPTILESCRQRGVDPVTDMIPVGPAQHYVSGGVRTDLWGRTSVVGLYACGEVACTGVHGANRLASNSLLEGLVFSARISEAIGNDRNAVHQVDEGDLRTSLVDQRFRRDIQQIMDRDAGVLRSAASLDDARLRIDSLLQETSGFPSTESWETTNVACVAAVLVEQALRRTETRGSHWREDFPVRDDKDWRVHQISTLLPDGSLVTTDEQVRSEVSA